MKPSINFNRQDNTLLEQMRAESRTQRWAGTAGFKTWAKQAHRGTLRTNRYGDQTSISFKTQQDLDEFKRHFGVASETVALQPPVVDILGRPIAAGDYGVFYSNVYEVLETNVIEGFSRDHVRVMMVQKSKTTKPMVKHAGACCLLDRNDVLLWLLKQDAE